MSINESFSDFYNAWWFLYNHPLFDNEGTSMFLSCLDVCVAKVNPHIGEIDKDKKKNTRVEVWLEAGKYDKEYNYHDLDLDCGAKTYEEAIIQMANLLLNKYGNGVDSIEQ